MVSGADHPFATSGADVEIFCPVMLRDALVAGRKFGNPVVVVGPICTVCETGPRSVRVQSSVSDPEPVTVPTRPAPPETLVTVPVPETLFHFGAVAAP